MNLRLNSPQGVKIFRVNDVAKTHLQVRLGGRWVRLGQEREGGLGVFPAEAGQAREQEPEEEPGSVEGIVGRLQAQLDQVQQGDGNAQEVLTAIKEAWDNPAYQVQRPLLLQMLTDHPSDIAEDALWDLAGCGKTQEF